MKKFFLVLMSAALLVGFAACENKDKADNENGDLEITEQHPSPADKAGLFLS